MKCVKLVSIVGSMALLGSVNILGASNPCVNSPMGQSCVQTNDENKMLADFPSISSGTIYDIGMKFDSKDILAISKENGALSNAIKTYLEDSNTASASMGATNMSNIMNAENSYALTEYDLYNKIGQHQISSASSISQFSGSPKDYTTTANQGNVNKTIEQLNGYAKQVQSYKEKVQLDLLEMQRDKANGTKGKGQDDYQQVILDGKTFAKDFENLVKYENLYNELRPTIKPKTPIKPQPQNDGNTQSQTQQPQTPNIATIPLTPTPFAINQTEPSLTHMQDSLKTLQGALKNLNYPSDNAITSSLQHAFNAVNQITSSLKNNPQVNVYHLNNQITDAKEAIANVENALNNVIKGNIPDEEKTNLENALKVIQNASKVVYQAQSNAFSVEASLGIVPTITLPSTHTQKVSGSAYGVDVQIGYKYFFGKTKHWGIRGYATYAYMQSNLGHTTNIQGAGLGVGQANNHTYGAGFDFLYNFHESQDGVHTAGILLGTELLGSTWVNQGQSIWHARMEAIKALGGTASMNTSYFQIPLVVGFRSNFSKHSGIELGLKIPLVVNYYFRSNYDGFEQSTFYKNNIKLYFNYVVNF
ncbi:outer membrane protein [Helicobacter cetorum]|uniref:outer membrane protein n=1 Tax=Helicobacter cetorum TaxID=138563 RepID=UPI000CF0B747|nr:outer membrane protein [Helicobacter cetorum]